MKDIINKITTKKDFIYWIIILIGLLVATLTFKLGDNKDVVSYFGFAGTLIAIILSLLAITYSLFQGSSSVVSTAKLVESADKIEQVTSNLKSVDVNEVLKKIDEIKLINKDMGSKLDSYIGKSITKQNIGNELTTENMIGFKYNGKSVV